MKDVLVIKNGLRQKRKICQIRIYDNKPLQFKLITVMISSIQIQRHWLMLFILMLQRHIDIKMIFHRHRSHGKRCLIISTGSMKLASAPPRGGAQEPGSYY